jgi:hypothetical protein
MWAKPQHNPAATIRMMAIAPKYPCFCRVGECWRISVDHLELALKRFGIISSSLYSDGCSASEQNWSLHPISFRPLNIAKVAGSGSMT